MTESELKALRYAASERKALRYAQENESVYDRLVKKRELLGECCLRVWEREFLESEEK